MDIVNPDIQLRELVRFRMKMVRFGANKQAV
nr:MAG TPA: hypothetical protein [Caudoviricetes sp.]